MQPINPSQSFSSLEGTQPADAAKPQQTTPADAARVIQDTERESKAEKTFTITKPIPDEMNPIWKAAAQGKWEEVERLINENKDFDVNAAPASGLNGGKTVAWFAAKANRWDLVDKLLNMTGADPNISPQEGDDAGKTLLWISIRGFDGDVGDFDEDIDMEKIREGFINVFTKLIQDPTTDKNAGPLSGVSKGETVSRLFFKERIYEKFYGVKDLIPTFKEKSVEEYIRDFKPDLTHAPSDVFLSPSDHDDYDTDEHMDVPLYDILLEQGIDIEVLLKHGGGDFNKPFDSSPPSYTNTNLYAEAIINGVWDVAEQGLKDHPDNFCKGLDPGKKIELIAQCLDHNKLSLAKALFLNKDFFSIDTRPDGDHYNMLYYIGSKLRNDSSDLMFAALKADLANTLLEASKTDSKHFNQANQAREQIKKELLLHKVAFESGSGTNSLLNLPPELLWPIVRELLREKVPYIDLVSNDTLASVLYDVQQVDLKEKHLKSVDWLTKRTFGVLKADILGVGGPQTTEVKYKDFQRLWEQAIDLVEKKHKRELVLDQKVRDKLVEAFQDITPPVTRRKLEALITKACENQLK